MRILSLSRFGLALRFVLPLLFLLATLSNAPGQSAGRPGQGCFGSSNYVEYLVGDLPLIISAPHGGGLKPAEVPDRKDGEFTSDANTEELARTLYHVFHDSLGHYPHVVISRLERVKVDCNREIEEGAGPHPAARQAWEDFHRFIELARSNVLTRSGKGFYIDLHGQSHPIRRVELGYCLTHSQLTNVDAVLNAQPAYARASSISTLARRTPVPFAELLRGTNSLGALLFAKGYPAVPSPAMPDPGEGNSFFDGGYNVRRHGSARGGSIDGVQMEVNFTGIRDTALNRTNFSRALAQVVQAYFTNYYSLDLRAGSGSLGLLDQPSHTGGD